MGVNNDTRAERARDALRAYVEAKGEVFENSGSEVAELVADLLHLAARDDGGEEGAERAVRVARMHFDAEYGRAEDEG